MGASAPYEDEDDDEILSSSTTGDLWKLAFGRRGGAQFLDICLLKKAYMKASEDMSDEEEEEEDTEIVSSIVNTLIDRTISHIEEQDNDEIDLAERIGKRSLSSTVNFDSDTQQLKRLRSDPVNTNVSV